ncbi:hypothetical protein LPJ53_005893 [Coemansia erecta]|uniref:Uncharacterized protein n=1 Tax=Coemansia erecta TaxID=147472 RepID=A0A9W7XU00_9FUNG|nr:hypothetical protein LPJ53_005893 [Coemansia erecta]
MPTMRRSSKAAGTKSEWTGESTSPLSSLSTPAGSEPAKAKAKAKSKANQNKKKQQQQQQNVVRRSSRRLTQALPERTAADAEDDEKEEEEEAEEAASGSEAGESDAVDELLTGAARAIRAQVSSGQLEGGEQSDGADGRRRSALKRKGSAGGSGSGAKRRAGRRSLAAAGNADDGGDNNSDNDGDNDGDNNSHDGDAKDDSSSTPAKWRPGKRGRPPKHAQAQRVAEQSAADEATGTADASDAEAEAEAEADADSDSGSDADADAETDPAGELKIDRDGHLLGGREFICPVVQSPFRRNTRRQYILTMDCCRFTGARDSYMLFKQHPRLGHVETTQQERDMLAEQRLIPKVTRFRTIRMVTARAAFREFGARLVRDGRYVADDYWEAAARREARYPAGTLVANMSVFRELQAAQAAGVAPGVTRKARGAATPLRSPKAAGDAADAPALPVAGWAALEPQGRAADDARRAAGQARAAAAGGDPAGEQTGIGGGGGAGRPVFPRARAAATAEAAFGAAAATHRAHFSDDRGFLDGLPLVHSLAAAWPRAVPSDGAGDGALGPAAYALARSAREFNAAVRVWREDNGGTWVDPHTGLRQVPAGMQPTRAGAERVDDAEGRRLRRAGRALVDAAVAFVGDAPGQAEQAETEKYPLALLPGQFQGAFAVHGTRFGQTQAQAMQSYALMWMHQANVHQHQQQQLQQQRMRAARRWPAGAQPEQH